MVQRMNGHLPECASCHDSHDHLLAQWLPSDSISEPSVLLCFSWLEGHLLVTCIHRDLQEVLDAKAIWGIGKVSGWWQLISDLPISYWMSQLAQFPGCHPDGSEHDQVFERPCHCQCLAFYSRRCFLEPIYMSRLACSITTASTTGSRAIPSSFPALRWKPSCTSHQHTGRPLGNLKHAGEDLRLLSLAWW